MTRQLDLLGAQYRCLRQRRSVRRCFRLYGRQRTCYIPSLPQVPLRPACVVWRWWLWCAQQRL